MIIGNGSHGGKKRNGRIEEGRYAGNSSDNIRRQVREIVGNNDSIIKASSIYRNGIFRFDDVQFTGMESKDWFMEFPFKNQGRCHGFWGITRFLFGTLN
jgi:hypothetical protein